MSRLVCFCRESFAADCPRSEVEADLLSLRRVSLDDWPREEVREGMRWRDEPEPDEFLRCAELPSVQVHVC
jgi:hypothetical protein